MSTVQPNAMLTNHNPLPLQSHQASTCARILPAEVILLADKQAQEGNMQGKVKDGRKFQSPAK
jgi:hypothetical protein